jgi:hypothetical protein
LLATFSELRPAVERAFFAWRALLVLTDKADNIE